MDNQLNFIKACKDKSEAGSFANELSDLLGVNPDAAYRRMRASTALTYDEIERMCLHYDVSFDSVVNYQGTLVPFQFNAMFREGFSIIEYLENIAAQMKHLASDPNSKIMITAMELPYFRQFGYPMLSRFKVFFWMRSVLNLDKYATTKFGSHLELEEYDLLTASISSNYKKVESVEIWTPETMDSSLQQVQYYLESGLFGDKEAFHQICQEFENLLDEVEREAEIGKKISHDKDGSSAIKFQMYQSDVFLSNNSIQVTTNNKLYTYVSFNSFNSLMSHTPLFSTECERWIEQIRSKSILLSEVSERLRFQYFRGLRTKLDRLKAKGADYMD